MIAGEVGINKGILAEFPFFVIWSNGKFFVCR